MKKLHKLLALLLALAMVFCLVACEGKRDKDDDDEDEKKEKSSESKKDKDETEEEADKAEEDEDAKKASNELDALVGEWNYRIDLADALASAMTEELGDSIELPTEGICIDLGFAFNQDGTFILSATLDEDSMRTYYEALVDILVDLMYEMAAKEGLSKDAIDSEYKSQYGMDVKGFFEALMEEAMKETLDEMELEPLEGFFKLDSEGGVIYFAEKKSDLEDEEAYIQYSMKDGKLIIETVVNDDIEEALEALAEYGMEFPWTFEKI